MAPLIEKLPVAPTMLGEGPHWDSRRQTLYFVSIMERELHRYVPATKEHAKTKIDTECMPSFIIPVTGSDDLFSVGQGHKVHVLRWDGQTASRVSSVLELAELDTEHPPNMINDGKVDPRGRLFTGTVGVGDGGVPSENELFKPSETGSFYSITGDGVVKRHDTGVKTSNGIAFDLKRKALYHVDTFADVIRRFDYDVDTGETSNKSILFNYKESGQMGLADGMTIDTHGNLWVASYQGSCVLKIDPDVGKVVQSVVIPAADVTSVTFGGPHLDVLYVTTGYPRDFQGDSPGGGTYAVTGLGVRGYENLPFDCKLLKK